MAKKKRRKKRARTMSAPRRTRKRSTGVRRVRRRKKGMLSDFFTPQSGKSMMRTAGGGALAGGIASIIDRATPNQTPLRKAGIMALGAIAAGAAKKPALTAGFAAVATYIAVGQIPTGGTMADGWANQIDRLPQFIPMSDPYQLADPYLLSQNQQAAYMLSQAVQTSSYMPDYGPQYMQLPM